MTKATTSKESEKANKPALHIRVGNVKIPVWRNEGDDGVFYYKAGQPELSYRGSDGNFHTSKSYSGRDLINLIKASALAHSELLKRNYDERSAEEDETEEAA